jgi:membrane associated rhomboid family serine protease
MRGSGDVLVAPLGRACIAPGGVGKESPPVEAAVQVFAPDDRADPEPATLAENSLVRASALLVRAPAAIRTDLWTAATAPTSNHVMLATPAIRSLMIANGVFFLLQLIFPAAMLANFALWAPGSGSYLGSPGFQVWQVVTYAFLHGNLMHLAFNMFGLWMFGSDMERTFGTRWMWRYYFVCVVSAALVQILVGMTSGGPAYPTVGASGGVFGLLLAFGMTFPRRTVMLIFPPIPMPAWLFVTLYAFLELYLGATGSQAGVAHFAHLGGMLGGYIMLKNRGRRSMR